MYSLRLREAGKKSPPAESLANTKGTFALSVAAEI
jgi:hypothetical protein